MGAWGEKGLKDYILSHNKESMHRAPSLLISVDTERIKAIIEIYADQYAMPLPSCLPNYRDFMMMLLPSDTTRLMVHNLYLEAAQGSDFPSVRYSKFIQLWADLCSQISIMKPSPDLCHFCQLNTTRLGRSSNLTEDE